MGKEIANPTAAELSAMADKYVTSAQLFGNPRGYRDVFTGITSAETVDRIGSQLRSSELGRQTLEQMLKHEDVNVRFWAGRHSLTFATELAISVLEEIALGGELVADSAMTALISWRFRKALGLI